MLRDFVNDTFYSLCWQGVKKMSFEVLLLLPPPLVFAQDELAFQI